MRPASRADALRLANQSHSHTVWVLSKLLPLHSALGQVSLCVSLSRTGSHFPTPGLMDTSLVGFQSQMFWVLISQVQALRVGMSGVGYKPFAPQGEALDS